jgi:hypothetical protein
MDDTTLVLVIVGVVAVLGISGFAYWWRRPRVDETFYHLRCRGCKRRLRYQARQVGHKGKCSHCGGDVLFPPIAQSID